MKASELFLLRHDAAGTSHSSYSVYDRVMRPMTKPILPTGSGQMDAMGIEDWAVFTRATGSCNYARTGKEESIEHQCNKLPGSEF